jgi:hypothetical protein
VTILQKRLQKFTVAQEKYAMCETHLETIEDAIRYIYEQSMTMNKPEEIGFQLDNLLTDVDETAELLDTMDLDTHESQAQEYYSEAKLDELLMQIEAKKASSNESGAFNEASYGIDDSNQAILNENFRTSESTSSNSSSKKPMRQ